MTGRQLTIFWVSALVVASLLVWLTSGCDTARAQTSGYRFLGQYTWLPADQPGGTHALNLEEVFGGQVALVSMYSSADFRCFVMPVNNLANGEGMHDDPSAAQLDSLYDQANLLPAAGVSIPGDLYWLVAPAPADSIRIFAYEKRVP